MKIIMVLNQIQAGVGTKDDTHFPLTATQNQVGPGNMMKPMMAKYDEQLFATIYCEQDFTRRIKQLQHGKLLAWLSVWVRISSFVVPLLIIQIFQK